MKKLLIAAFAFFTLTLAGCLKDNPNVDFSKVSGVVEFVYPGGASSNGVGSGMEYFAGGTFTFPPTDVADTVYFMANLAAPNPLGKDIPLTIGYDANALTKYNANNTIQFLQMPDSCYTLLSKSGTIKAGKNLDTFYLVVYPSKIDPTQNYMAPISLLSATGAPISGNFGTIYFHTIGNPIAGPYNWDFRRWSGADSVTGSLAQSWDGQPTLFLPDDPLTIEVQSGYYTGAHYVLGFQNNAGVLSNFTLSINPADVKSFAAAGLTFSDGPHIVIADPINGVYRFYYQILRSDGSHRWAMDTYYK